MRKGCTMAEGMVVRKVELHAVRPEAANVRKVEYLRAERRAAVIPDASYIVNVYIENLPPPGGSGYPLPSSRPSSLPSKSMRGSTVRSFRNVLTRHRTSRRPLRLNQ